MYRRQIAALQHAGGQAAVEVLPSVPQLHEVGHQAFGAAQDRLPFDLARDGFRSFQPRQPQQDRVLGYFRVLGWRVRNEPRADVASAAVFEKSQVTRSS